MAMPLQRDQLGYLRYQSQVLWRDTVSNVEDSVIGGALRDCECDLDAFQRLLGDAAVQEIERECAFALQLQVRTIRLHRFPCGYEPIRLDWRSAFTPTAWSALVDQAAAEDDLAVKAKLDAKIAQVTAQFGEGESAPLSISYPDCQAESGRAWLPVEDYRLLNAESGDSVVKANDCMWPLLPHSGGNYSGYVGLYSRRSGTSEWSNWGKNYVEIKYVVGYASPSILRAQMPLFVANVAALFNYRYENPEIMPAPSSIGGKNSRTYELLLQYFNKHLKWRV